jgi:alkylation response protein AidB-like acyl-CoA dehydrogenase
MVKENAPIGYQSLAYMLEILSWGMSVVSGHARGGLGSAAIGQLVRQSRSRDPSHSLRKPTFGAMAMTESGGSDISAIAPWQCWIAMPTSGLNGEKIFVTAGHKLVDRGWLSSGQ